MRCVRWLGIAVALVVGMGDASAKPIVPDLGPRSGIGFGAAIGRGSIAIECDICDNVDPISEGVSGSLWAGFLLNPRLMIMGEYWTVRYSGRGSDWFTDTSKDQYVAQHMLLANAQLWVSRRWFVRAGLGAGWHESDSRYADLDRPPPTNGGLPALAPNNPAPWITPATAIGVGLEFAHTRTFAAEVFVRAGATHRPEDEYQVHNVALTFGASWY